MNQPISRIAQEELHSIKNDQSENCNSNKQQIRQVITKCMHSKIFRTWSIFLTIATSAMLLSGLASIMDSPVAGIFALLLSIPAIVSTVCVWKVYTSKKDILTSSDLNGSKAFIIYMQVMCILYSIASCIVFLLFMLVGDFLGGLFNGLDSIFKGQGSSSDDAGFGTLKIIFFLIGAAVTFVIIEFAIALNHSRKYIKYLQTALDSGEYDPSVKTHKIRMYILGGLRIFSGLILFVVLFLFMFLLPFSKAYTFFNGCQYICTGIYIIVTSSMFNKFHIEICNKINENCSNNADNVKLNEDLMYDDSKYYSINTTELHFENKTQKSKICNKCGSKVTGKFCTNCGQLVEKIYACPNCGKEYKEAVRFCGECGHSFEIAKETVCPQCGTVRENDENFCKECGYSFINN